MGRSRFVSVFVFFVLSFPSLFCFYRARSLPWIMFVASQCFDAPASRRAPERERERARWTEEWRVKSELVSRATRRRRGEKKIKDGGEEVR